MGSKTIRLGMNGKAQIIKFPKLTHFAKRAQSFTLNLNKKMSSIVELLGGQVVGDENIKVCAAWGDMGRSQHLNISF